VERLQRAVLSFQVCRDALTTFEGNFVTVEVQHFKGVVLEQMLHDDVNAIVTKSVLANRKLLQADVVLKHLSEVNRDTLADCLVNRVFNVEFFECVVATVQDRKDTNDAVVVYLIVTKVERQKLVVREQQFCHHHRAIRLNLV
jgi:hypothetical protein